MYWIVTTVDGRHIQTLSIRYNPFPPKFNVNVTWGALAPMDERNQTLNITFANTWAETLRFGGAGVQHSMCCRVWFFCPSTLWILVVLVFSSTGAAFPLSSNIVSNHLALEQLLSASRWRDVQTHGVWQPQLFFLFLFAWLQRSISTSPIGASQQFISQQHTHKSLIAFAMVFSLPSRTLFRLRFPSWFLQVTDFLSEKIRKGTKKIFKCVFKFLAEMAQDCLFILHERLSFSSGNHEFMRAEFRFAWRGFCSSLESWFAKCWNCFQVVQVHQCCAMP